MAMYCSACAKRLSSVSRSGELTDRGGGVTRIGGATVESKDRMMLTSSCRREHASLSATDA
jgi:hypothetical protein